MVEVFEAEDRIFPDVIEFANVARIIGRVVQNDACFSTKSGVLKTNIRFSSGTGKFAVRIARPNGLGYRWERDKSGFLFADSIKELVEKATPIFAEYKHEHIDVPDFKPFIVLYLTDKWRGSLCADGVVAMIYRLEWRAKHGDPNKWYMIRGSFGQNGEPVKESIHDGRSFIVVSDDGKDPPAYHAAYHGTVVAGVFPYSKKVLKFCKSVDKKVNALREKVSASIVSFQKKQKGMIP